VTSTRLAFVSLAAALLVGCSSGPSQSNAGGSGGSEPDVDAAAGRGGSGGGTGGRGGAGGGGTGGAGGSAGTGGTGGTGGAGGTGGSTADAGMAPRDSGGGGGSGGGGLDACFAGLRPLKDYQVSTKVSADGSTRARVALEIVPGGVGTSGTKVWRFIRFALERGGMNVCVTDMAQLKYMGSRHNCMDTATATASGITYKIERPEREMSRISASGEAAWPAVMLTNTSCMSDNQCRSGGPCD
jgi:hypothetical protein